MEDKKKLFGDNPLLVYPDIAAKIGLNEAIVLHQIHYWTEINRKAKKSKRNGYFWTFNPYRQWQAQFPFWGIATVVRVFRNLEKMKLLVSDFKFNKKGKSDRTKWYRVNYELLETLQAVPINQFDKTILSKCIDQFINMIRPLPETNTEISKETKKKIGNLQASCRILVNFHEFLKTTNITGYENQIQVVEYYINKYWLRYGKHHPKMTWQEWNDIVVRILYDRDIFEDLDSEEGIADIKAAIDKLFETEFKDYRHDIRNFEKFIINKLWETAYRDTE